MKRIALILSIITVMLGTFGCKAIETTVLSDGSVQYRGFLSFLPMIIILLVLALVVFIFIRLFKRSNKGTKKTTLI